MVTESTVRKHIKSAIEPYKTDKTVVEYINRGGYPVKSALYEIPKDKVREISEKCGYYAEIGKDADGFYRIYFDTTADLGIQISYPTRVKHISTGFTGKAEQINEHHSYKTTMDVGDDFIEKIIRQTEKAVFVRMVTPKGNRYERWLPKSTLIPVERELDRSGVVSQYSQISETWQVKILGGSVSRNKTYGNKESFERRIKDLYKQGCKVFYRYTVDKTHTVYILDPSEHLEDRVQNVIYGWETMYKSTKDPKVRDQYYMLIQALYRYKASLNSKKAS